MEVHKMNEEAISYIMQKMSNCLDNSQRIRLEKTLEEALRGEDIVSLKPSEELLEEFLSVKRLEGRSEKTLFLYKFNIGKILEKSDKNVCVMNTDDIRQYLSEYQMSGVSKATVDNVRRNLSSFFIRINSDEQWPRRQSTEECLSNRYRNFLAMRRSIPRFITQW